MIELLEDKLTPVDEGDLIMALVHGWKRFYGWLPSADQMGCCLAQMNLETGRMKYCHNWNVGNIKKKHETKWSKDDGKDWQMFRCSEVLKVDGKWKEVWFDPPHPQTHFRAYRTLEDGVVDYIKFLALRDRYKAAWSKVLDGDPRAFSHELKQGGYYTASEALYTRTVVRLFEEFRKKSKKKLESPEAQELFKEMHLEEMRRILNLAIIAPASGEWGDDDEERCRASITSNWDDDEPVEAPPEC